ncbi:MAG TPA: LytR C-terminal domain-containing protein [Solirubrobacteraceae bacterium]|jgi:hypothetical protein|nr:LytR C-terminal domain-containing protein [Solirubrobacteraceae bacterium]
MVTIPFALSVHKFVNSVGADVGFASIIAVAILILLYFAHARETATLRDRLDEAHTRIGGLEARIGQLMHAQAAAQRGRPGQVAPAPITPAPVRPMGSAIASVRRVPTPATAALTAVGTPAVAGAARAGSATPAAPVGMAAPALASATKLIPDPAARPAPAPAGAPDDTVFVPAATAAAAKAAAKATNGKAAETAPLTGATQAIPAVATASARTPSASPRGGGAPPPRVQIGAEPATAGASARRTATTPRPTPILPSAHEPGRRRFAGRMLPLVIGGIAAAVIVVGLVVIINTGGSTTGNVSHNNTTAKTGANLAHQHQAPVPFKASKFTVAVLNGTAVSNLAADVGTKLAGAGYKKGNATNAASQTQALTVVYYMPGSGAKANRIAAQHVAETLSLGATRVHQATQGSIQSCSVSAAGTPLNSCDADVIVSVGADRASLASSASSG